MDLKPHAIVDGSLKELLRKHGIGERADLERFILEYRADAIGEPVEEPRLHVLTAADLLLDGENRLYDDEIAFRNRVLDVDRLVLQNSTKASFINCILCGSLVIGKKGYPFRDLYLDECIVLGRIVIGQVQGDAEFLLHKVNSSSLEVDRSVVRSVHLSQCQFAHLRLEETRLESLYVTGSYFHSLSVRKSPVRHVTFDHRQVNLSLPIAVHEDLDAWAEHPPVPMFRFRRFDLDAPEPCESNEGRFETISFLRERTGLRGDKESYARIRAIEATAYQSRTLGRALVGLLGAFLSPARILLLWLIIFVLCAGFYASPFAAWAERDSSDQLLSYPDALYFSGITTATIGYGDIAPIGITKCVAVMEGFLGIVLGGCFVVALVRRYVED